MTTSAAGLTLSLVVPAYNEAENLPLLFEKALKVLPKNFSDFEILVVDDGSRDSTAQVVETYGKKFSCVRLIAQPENLGVGAALRVAFKQARFLWVCQVPADNQFDVEEIEKFLPYLESNDIVQGWRVNLNYTLARRFVSWTYRAFLRFLFGVRLKDPTWVKMIRLKVAQSIPITTNGFFGEIEILIQAQRLRCRFSEVAVHTQARLYGESSASQLSRILKTCLELVRFRFLQ